MDPSHPSFHQDWPESRLFLRHGRFTLGLHLLCRDSQPLSKRRVLCSLESHPLLVFSGVILELSREHMPKERDRHILLGLALSQWALNKQRVGGHLLLLGDGSGLASHPYEGALLLPISILR